MYCSLEEAYATAGITSTEVSEEDAARHIKRAESEADKFCFSTFWSLEDNGTASAGSSTTLTDSNKSWTKNKYQYDYLWLYSGTGSGQVRQITSHTGSVITVDRAWSVNPSTDTLYRVIHCGSDPYVSEAVDGTGLASQFTPFYPIVVLESLSIDDTTVTPSSVYKYPKTGQLTLSNTSEVTRFYGSLPQQVEWAFWYGVYPIPSIVQRYAAVLAAIKMLNQQMGGTFDDPSSFELPEASVTVGQAYINIEGTLRRLVEEQKELEGDPQKGGGKLPRYPTLA